MISRLRRALLALLPLGAAAQASATNSTVNTSTAAPVAGAQAPDFSLPDQDGRQRSLQEWRGKWLVLYFYPKNDTPGCTTEACNFRDDWLQLTELGAQVVGISVDSSASHKAFIEKYKLPFPLLADAQGTVAQRYGAISDFVVVKFAKRQTFLIDPQGRIAKVYLSVNATRHSAEVQADLRRLQQAAR